MSLQVLGNVWHEISTSQIGRNTIALGGSLTGTALRVAVVAGVGLTLLSSARWAAQMLQYAPYGQYTNYINPAQWVLQASNKWDDVRANLAAKMMGCDSKELKRAEDLTNGQARAQIANNFKIVLKAKLLSATMDVAVKVVISAALLAPTLQFANRLSGAEGMATWNRIATIIRFPVRLAV